MTKEWEKSPTFPEGSPKAARKLPEGLKECVLCVFLVLPIRKPRCSAWAPHKVNSQYAWGIRGYKIIDKLCIDLC